MTKKIVLIVIAVLGLVGVLAYKRGGAPPAGTAAGGAGGGRGPARPPMPVEFTTAKRAPLAEQVLVVGNLIGEATVDVVPRVNGRLQSVAVKMGDPVRQGQVIARVEDREIQEQVRQAEASHQVSQATIRQREADIRLAKTNLDRSKSLYDRQLLPQQTFDDTASRYEAATAQLDLARAQFEQAKARLEELKITLQNTIIVSPVDGFVGKRFLDPGAFASVNSPIASVVDIRTVRLVANLVERDMRRVAVGTPGSAEVDAFPGERFTGKVSRVAPVFDPSTRTAEMEIEVPNPGYRLKPGMYARVRLTVDVRANAITVPRNAIVEVNGRTGVFVAARTQPAAKGDAAKAADAPTLTAKFQPVETGLRDGELIEITSDLANDAQIVTTGASALKDGDRVVAASVETSGARGRAEGQPAAREGSNR